VAPGLAGLTFALAFGALAAVALTLPTGWVAAIALGGGSLGGLVFAGWAGWKLTMWPHGRIGFFRDRLVVIQGKHEMSVLWGAMETVTLSQPDSWPRVKLTDRLTLKFKTDSPLAFKPAEFGLEPAACRDLILRLRDDSRLRARLPEFDSARDLAISPVVAGELTEPRL
jgi:hypothetical protein